MHVGSTATGLFDAPMARVVAFAVGERRWGLPLECVERVVAMVAVTPLGGAPAGVRGAINVHGAVVPVLDLGRRLGDPPHPLGADAHLVLARTRRRRVALPVDEALDVIAFVPRAASGPLAGIAAQDDGLLAVYDLDAFLSDGEEDQLTLALAEVAS